MTSASHFTNTLLAICFGFSVPLSAQSPHTPRESPCVVEDIDTPTMPACVIQTRGDGLYIPKRYWMHSSFNRYGLSGFWIQSFGRVYINRSGRILIRDVALMDNGLDDFHHGLVRINRDQMWGYADPSGRIVVPVKYSCALNYKDKYEDIGPFVCVGCRIEQQGDYQACVDGTWFSVDSHGNVASTPSPQPLSAKSQR
jgi:hypothetical protein